jgi:RNA polymerase sigma-B factor
MPPVVSTSPGSRSPRSSVSSNGTSETRPGRYAPRTVADIAGHLGISEDDIIEGLEGDRAYYSTSLSTPISEGGTELGDTLGGEDAGYDLAELRIALGPALAGLAEREQKIVSLRFYGNLTQQQIAEQIGVSQMHVSRLLARALTKLRQQLDTDHV